MRALIVTLLPLPDPERDVHGIYQRLRLFVQAAGATFDHVDIAHFVAPDTQGSKQTDGAAMARFWGTPVNVRRLPLNAEPRRWWETAKAPFQLSPRGDFRPFLGPEQTRALQDLLDEKTEMVFAHRLPAFRALTQTQGRLPPIFFDLDDVEHLVKKRLASETGDWLGTLRHLMEVPALQQAEKESLAIAQRSFVCSTLDRKALARAGMDVSRTVVIPNAVDMPEPIPPVPMSKSVLFLGNYGHSPNAEAADRLVTRIWPHILEAVPEARLFIAGRHPEYIPAFARRQESVVYTGLVDDLFALYRTTRVVCCPLTNGGGTRIKLIEAAVHGRPMVSTEMGAEGLNFISDKDILIREGDEELASACVDLLRDDALANRIARSAAAKARSKYALSDVRELVIREIQSAFPNHRPFAAQQSKRKSVIGTSSSQNGKAR